MDNFYKKNKSLLEILLLLSILFIIISLIIFSNNRKQPTKIVFTPPKQTNLIKPFTESSSSPILSVITQTEEKSVEQQVQEEEKNEQPDKTTQKVVLQVGDKIYQTDFTDNTSLLELMNNLSRSDDFQFNGREYAGMGYFVEEINGIKNDAKQNKFWIYYINGQSAKVGISNYIIKFNDLITWKYEASVF